MSGREDLLAAVERLGLPAGLVDEAEASYAEPPRAYHSFAHVLEVFARWEEIARGPGWAQPSEVLVALLFHDAIYEAGRADNEARSADAARRALAARGVPIDAERVATLIALTAGHGRQDGAAIDAEAARFLDCDMAILGAPQERFDRYEREIAAEYGALPREVYTAGRRAFLARLLASPRIFLSEYFHQTLEQAARDNLRRVL